MIFERTETSLSSVTSDSPSLESVAIAESTVRFRGDVLKDSLVGEAVDEAKVVSLEGGSNRWAMNTLTAGRHAQIMPVCISITDHIAEPR